jgi:hypothetical protein
MSGETIEHLEKALLGPVKAKPEELADAVASVSPGAQSSDIASAIQALMTMSLVRGRLEQSPLDFARAVTQSLVSSDQLSKEAGDELSKRLTSLLELDPLGATAKTIDLRSEHTNLFCNVRILTDLRPVFGEDPVAPPNGFILMHTLKLEYHNQGEHQEIYVAVDDDDLQRMRSVLERAVLKGKSLRSMLRKSNIEELE